MAKKKTFSKLRNHLTSTELDEKAAVLESITRMPTNNTAFVFSGDPDNPQGNSFETITDGETDETDYNIGENPTSATEARDTTGLFNAGGDHSKGEFVKTVEPPGDTSYVLGPMAAMYYTWSYPWTMVGYIRESDRKMVNLGRIDGKLSDWDGSSGNASSGSGTFYSYGQLTTEQALWFRDIKKAFGNTNDPATYSYRAFYPGPPSATPDAYGRYPCILTGISKVKPNTHPDSTPLDKQAGDNFSAQQGRSQSNPNLVNAAVGHGLSRKRAEEMSEEELERFVEQQDALQADIDKHSADQQRYEDEARRIAVQFGVDVALTLFGGGLIRAGFRGLGALAKGVQGLNNSRKIAAAARALQKSQGLSKAEATRRAAEAARKAEAARRGAAAAEKARKAAEATRKANQTKGSLTGRSFDGKTRLKPQPQRPTTDPNFKPGKLTGRSIDGKTRLRPQPQRPTPPRTTTTTRPTTTRTTTTRPTTTRPTTTRTTTSSQQGITQKVPKNQIPKKDPKTGKFRESDLNIKDARGNVTAKVVKNPKTGQWERISKPGKGASRSDLAKWEKLEGQVSNKAWDAYTKTGQLNPGVIGNPLRAMNPFVKGGLTSGPTALAKKYGIPAGIGAGAAGVGIGNEIRKGVEGLINKEGASRAIDSITGDKSTSNLSKLSELDAATRSLEKSNDKNAISKLSDSLIDTGKGVLDDIKAGLSNVKDFAVNNRNGLVDGITTLTDVMDTLKNARINNNIVNGQIVDGAEGSPSKPLVQRMSDSTAASIVNNLDFSKPLGSQIQSITSKSPGLLGGDGNLGAKGIHNNLPNYGLGTNETPEPYVNENGDLIIPDTYAFRPTGFEDYPQVKAWGAISKTLGGDQSEAEKDMATVLDQSVGAFARLLGVNIPGRKDPVVYFNTVIPKSQIDKIRSKKNISEVKFESLNVRSYKKQSDVSLERKREIFGHLTKPVVLPETKQKTYKVSPGQKYKDKNKKPEGTDSQDMSKLFNKNIGGPQPFKPQERTSWTKDFIAQNVMKSQEKMNGVLEMIGDGKHAFDHAMNDYKRMGAKELEQYWGKNPNMYSFLFNGKKYNVTRKEHVEGDLVVFMQDQNGVKSNMLQSELNEKLQEQNEKWIEEAYFKSHPVIPEKKESTYDRIKARFLENKKIAPEFPAEPPPKMVNGYHPKFGKHAARYKKLDPASANAMPETGDPETDAIVRKQKTINKIKSMAKK